MNLNIPTEVSAFPVFLLIWGKHGTADPISQTPCFIFFPIGDFLDLGALFWLDPLVSGAEAGKIRTFERMASCISWPWDGCPKSRQQLV